MVLYVLESLLQGKKKKKKIHFLKFLAEKNSILCKKVLKIVQYLTKLIF